MSLQKLFFQLKEPPHHPQLTTHNSQPHFTFLIPNLIQTKLFVCVFVRDRERDK